MEESPGLPVLGSRITLIHQRRFSYKNKDEPALKNRDMQSILKFYTQIKQFVMSKIYTDFKTMNN
jgi:hypothetical protein